MTSTAAHGRRQDDSFGSSLGLGLDPALVDAVHYLGDAPTGTRQQDRYAYNDALTSQGSVDEPRTPPQISSPSIPSPLSLHHLGITPISPLARQLASRPPGEDDDLDLFGSAERVSDDDGKDVLIQRLNDLAQRLAAGHDFAEDDVSAMHARVDDLERALSKASHKSPPPRRPRPARQFMSRPSSLHLGGGDQSEESFWAAPSPSLFRSRILDMVSSSSPSLLREESSKQIEDDEKREEEKSAMSLRDAIRIASEAEKLNKTLTALVTNLKARQEETEHIHGLLVTRAERAAQRILFLQARVKDLEEELQENDSELSFLRLGLKALEVQCPPDIDPELAQSISNWKMDWATLKNKRSEKRMSDIASSLGGSPTMST